MERDFTLRTYRELILTYQEEGYLPISLERYFEKGLPQDRTLLLRHDVDRAPERSLKMARLEHELGIRGTYYFRSVQSSFNPRIIRAISELGHEIGYHYEDLALWQGDMDRAVDAFRKNLEGFRGYYPVRTVCMHGSPLSVHDNKRLFERIDLKEEGIIGEPYLHIDAGRFFYLSDTGGRWDGAGSSVRDASEGDRIGVRSSFGLMEALRNDGLPKGVHQTVHPQRWIDEKGPWLWERSSQKAKNQLKKLLKRLR